MDGAGTQDRIQFPFSVVVWREMISLREFRGLGYLFADIDFPLLIFIFCLPFFLIVFLFRNIFIHRYTFEREGIRQHFIFGLEKSIPREGILSVTARENNAYLEIRWRKNKFSSTRTITVFRETLAAGGLQPGEAARALSECYTDRG